MAKKKVQAVSFEDLKALVVNEAKQNGNILTQEQIDEYLMNYDLSDELAEELLELYSTKSNYHFWWWFRFIRCRWWYVTLQAFLQWMMI